MKLSIIVPCYNEENSIPLLKERLKEVFEGADHGLEIICVNDGSTDNSVILIEEWIKEDHRVSLIDLSRNFGHQQAITAGLTDSTGDCVVILDADLQDPPEVIPDMIEKWKKGARIVFAQRLSRKEGFIRRSVLGLFYKFFVLISDLPVVINSGVFGLMDRVAVNHILNMGERNRFIPGLQGWVGFDTAAVTYDRQDRAAGKPKQTFRRLIKYALNAIFSFSYKPLRINFVVGFSVMIFFFVYGVVLIWMRLMNINVVRGFTTPTVAIFFIGGLLLISNGIMGEYVARIYDEVKGRPLYIVSRKVTRDKGGALSIKEVKA